MVLARASLRLWWWLGGVTAAVSVAEPLVQPLPVPPPAAVKIDLAVGAAGARALRLLGGQEVIVQVAAAPRRPVLWQFGASDTVLAHGAMLSGEDGAARLRLAMPTVRARTHCVLYVWSSGAEASRTAVVFPPRMLAEAAARLGGRRLAVLDDEGGVGRALGAEGVAFAAVRSDVERTFFEADTILVAGALADETAARSWAGLEPRIRAGACLVLLNPPVGWGGWGLRRVPLVPPAQGWMRLAPRLAAPLDPADLGVGPWPTALEAAADAHPLAWLEPLPENLGETGTAATPGSLLVAARAVGRGWVVVALAPGLDRPDTDAVGRALLDGLVLWSVEPDENPSRE